MKNNKTNFRIPRAWLRVTQAVVIALLPVLVSILTLQTSHAGTVTWKLDPTDGEWSTPSNWIPARVPVSTDTSVFNVSNETGVLVRFTAEIAGVVFKPGASAFTITAGDFFTISGVGITNDSGIQQTFRTVVVPGATGTGLLIFRNSATADNVTIINKTSSNSTFFAETTTAGESTIINQGGAKNGRAGGSTSFSDSATAANSTCIADGGMVSGAFGGGVNFLGSSTAGEATLIANAGLAGGGGSSILISEQATGGAARVVVFGDGTLNPVNARLDISGHDPRAPNVTVGSIEGNGEVILGTSRDNNLIVGGNNLGTTFAGLIRDSGFGGSLTKVGAGTLTLSRANTYVGGTTIESGKLVVSNRIGSGTGTGPVQVNAGTLGGKGTIAGAVTIGIGSGPGAVLSPGKGRRVPVTLTIQSALTFKSDATYDCGLNSDSITGDQVVANGATINGAAQFSFADVGNSTLSPGTVFIVINNTAATSIAGTFANLADGSTITIGSNTFQADYEGGNGNDLTLTVVP